MLNRWNVQPHFSAPILIEPPGVAERLELAESGHWQNLFNMIFLDILDQHQVGQQIAARKESRWGRSVFFWLALGVAALGLGVIGVVVPLLPTTPFLLVAAFAFARSSKRLHDWLVDHPTFGPLIKNWHAHGAISRRTKIVSVVSMVGVFGLALAMGAPRHVLLIQAVVLSIAAVFVVSRPLPPDQH